MSTAPDPRQGEIFAQERPRAQESASGELCACGCGRPLCRCGCRVHLTGRQEAFASKACNSRFYDAQHPRVGLEPEGRRKGTIKADILGVMSDGRWYTAAELAALVKAREHSVSARLAELRKLFRIESDAKNGNATRAHRFRLVLG